MKQSDVLQEKANAISVQLGAFYEKKNGAAGSRARKLLLELQQWCKAERVAIQNTKKSRKAETE